MVSHAATAPEAPGDGVTSSVGIPWRTRLDLAFAALGERMARSRRLIVGVQWAVVGIYAVLIVVPTLVPLPGRLDHVWNHVTVFAQFVFWGIWWPGVLISMILFGRLWCGVLCPEGALSERASRFSLGRAVPRWITWKGWPFVGFLGTTIYGQMISVYQYPAAVLVILGGSTCAAIVVGLVYGRDKRVWCRYLCPVNGVFALVSKLAPIHFRVDRAAWDRWEKPADGRLPHVDCAPLVPLRRLEGNSPCHMCGRCSGFRDAVALSSRSPNHEIVEVAGREPKPWESALIILGLLGVAAGAFRWTGSALWVDIKQALAEHLIDLGAERLLDLSLPWWILTNYPEKNDVMTVVDGAALIVFLGLETAIAAILFAGGTALAAALAAPWRREVFHHLVQTLIPIAAVGVILGLSMTTVSLARADGFDVALADPLRLTALTGAAIWSAVLARAVVRRHAVDPTRRRLAGAAMIGVIGLAAADWATLFWTP
ncbi:MAG: 4Fe-4S binding protein [Phyllobacteriaceae bacterium]|nr:4Fe-4S binding protein [Phyllobacteriaceae bacterium]